MGKSDEESFFRLAFMRNTSVLLVLIIGVGMLFSCSRDDNYAELLPVNMKGTEILSLVLTDKNGNDYNSFLIDDSTVHVCVPNSADLTDMSVWVDHNGRLANIGGFGEKPEHLDLSDFVNPYLVEVTSSDSLVKERKILIYNLPVLQVETPDKVEITSKTEKTEGCILTIFDGLGGGRFFGYCWNRRKGKFNLA